MSDSLSPVSSAPTSPARSALESGAPCSPSESTTGSPAPASPPPDAPNHRPRRRKMPVVIRRPRDDTPEDEGSPTGDPAAPAESPCTPAPAPSPPDAPKHHPRRRKMPVAIRRPRDATPEDEGSPTVDPPHADSDSSLTPVPTPPPQASTGPAAPAGTVNVERWVARKKARAVARARAIKHQANIDEHFTNIKPTPDDQQYPTFQSKAYATNVRKDKLAKDLVDFVGTALCYATHPSLEGGKCPTCGDVVTPPDTQPDDIILKRPQPTSQVNGAPEVQWLAKHWRCMTIEGRQRFYPADYLPEDKRCALDMDMMEGLDVSELTPRDAKRILNDIKACHHGRGKLCAAIMQTESDALLRAKKLSQEASRAEYREARTKAQKSRKKDNKKVREVERAAKKAARWQRAQLRKAEKAKAAGEGMDVDQEDKGEGSSKVQPADEDSITEPESEDEDDLVTTQR
ncbi:hypothetical protein GLOTRDRAFT_134673 [Gloeophyllum trabeum ATCC 11539]|uniref:PARP-type domain-containing protein n=1 Tax=Gloeophyllum trabeum (strain ATCC 11539 / FP-39264 / Madison 617) TaxID=670483 RepID=S7PQJ3_GLOTA|nr:uncharacterized protein GLOTRDRAFT_134673 [Gloeophyllum trabeum ATCC 11539]EPQ49738.1 hypothetical protein GLOTRDRAFT_134673 [Gloeophyllum trabeum ATCC 11539]